MGIERFFDIDFIRLQGRLAVEVNRFQPDSVKVQIVQRDDLRPYLKLNPLSAYECEIVVETPKKYARKWGNKQEILLGRADLSARHFQYSSFENMSELQNQLHSSLEVALNNMGYTIKND